MVKKEDHNFTVGQTAESLRRILPEQFHVREEKSLRHGKKSVPEPDVAVVSGRSSDYRPQPPSTSDVSLIVEVCHHTRKADYEQKYPRYAAARIPVYWIVDLQLRRVEVFTRPSGRRRSRALCREHDFSGRLRSPGHDPRPADWTDRRRGAASATGLKDAEDYALNRQHGADNVKSEKQHGERGFHSIHKEHRHGDHTRVSGFVDS